MPLPDPPLSTVTLTYAPLEDKFFWQAMSPRQPMGAPALDERNLRWMHHGTLTTEGVFIQPWAEVYSVFGYLRRDIEHLNALELVATMRKGVIKMQARRDPIAGAWVVTLTMPVYMQRKPKGSAMLAALIRAFDDQDAA